MLSSSSSSNTYSSYKKLSLQLTEQIRTKQLRNYYELGTELNFQKLKVAVNPMYRICLNFAKSCISSCLSKFYNKKKIHRVVFEI